jgi:hypothetical protein
MSYLKQKGVFRFGPYIQPEGKSHDAQPFFFFNNIRGDISCNKPSTCQNKIIIIK